MGRTGPSVVSWQPPVRARPVRTRTRVLITAYAVLLHMIACFYYAGMAKLHLYIERMPRVAESIRHVHSDIMSFFPFVEAVSVLLVVTHVLTVGAIAYRSTLLRSTGTRTRLRVVGVTSADIVRFDHHQRCRDKLRAAWETVNATLASYDRRFELVVGVDTYEFLVVLEIALQTFQVVKMSRLIASPWINSLVVVVVVLNCWFIPGTSVACRHKAPTFLKVVHLALDAALEIVYGMAIPFAIFYPYYVDADHIFYDSPFVNYYADTWYIRAVAENRQTFVTSWVDFVSKMLPGISLLLRLQSLLTWEARDAVRASRAKVSSIVPETASTAGPLVLRSSSSRGRLVLQFTLALWGTGILAAHLVATGVGMRGSDPGCLLETRPLGSTRYTCTVLEVSCTQKHIRGFQSELDAALRYVDPREVRGLIFSHCAALSMPPRLQSFPALEMIKIHNSTLAEWSTDAALTTHAHPALALLYVTETNLSGIPDGLLSPDIPQTLTDIEFCGTNLTDLPVDLFERWSQLMYFGLELSPGITRYPVALDRRTPQLVWLTLAVNAITALPDDVFAADGLSFFSIAGNPLTKLPSDAGAVASISSVWIASTGIAEAPPSWTTTATSATAALASGVSLFAGNTPLCARLQAASGAGDTAIATVPSWLQVRCVDGANELPYWYPLEHERQWRRANR